MAEVVDSIVVPLNADVEARVREIVREELRVVVIDARKAVLPPEFVDQIVSRANDYARDAARRVG